MSAKLFFSGSPEALAFSQEVQESFRAVLDKNYISDPNQGPVGFLTASIDGRYWSDTMWTRDAGTFLRELIFFGDFARAKEVWNTTIDHLSLNSEGYYTFPVYVYPHQPASGEEVDGMAVWLMSSLALWQRLHPQDQFRERIMEYLLADASPLRALLLFLKQAPFVKGAGEFGGGMDDTLNSYYNVVQNALVAMTLDRFARIGKAASIDPALCSACEQAAQRLQQRIHTHMVGEDGSWIWCLDPATEQPAAEQVLQGTYNAGFAGINGVLSHAADGYGVLPISDRDWFLAPSIFSFEKLLAHPRRMSRFVQYGYYAQFEKYLDGCLNSASYGQCYAIQCMLLLDRPELYTKALNYLANATLTPPYTVTRESPYWFYERYLAPDVSPMTLPGWEEGCGALNLVNVTEPMKCARLCIGLDDTGNDIRLVPRLPFQWTQAQAIDLPMRLPLEGTCLLNIQIQSDGAGCITQVVGESRHPLPTLHIRLGTAANPTWVTTPEHAMHFQEMLGRNG